MCVQYLEDYPILWLSQTLRFHSLIINLYHSISHSLHLFFYVFEMPCVIYIYLPPLNSSLFSCSFVLPVRSRWPFSWWHHNPFPWLLYILNQSHSVFSAPAFNPLSQLEKNRTTKFIGATKSSWFQPQSGPQWHLWGTPFMNPEFNPSLIPYNKHFRIFYEIKYSILWLYHSQWCTISATLQWCLCCQIRIIAVIFLVS